MSALAWLRLGLALAPDVRTAVEALFDAFKGDDPVAHYEAYEALRRAAFRARNKGR